MWHGSFERGGEKPNLKELRKKSWAFINPLDLKSKQLVAGWLFQTVVGLLRNVHLENWGSAFYGGWSDWWFNHQEENS